MCEVSTAGSSREQQGRPSTNLDFLIIQGRQFGDAVIGTGLIEAIGRSLPDARISVFTRPFFREIFANNPYVSRVYVANFPMGTVKHFGAWQAFALARQVIALRRENVSVVALSGDFRENLLGWLISPRRNFGVVWQSGHPFNRIVRPGMSGLLTRATRVSPAIVSAYAAMQMVAETIGATARAQPRVYNAQGQPITHRAAGRAVGLHMSATQECKMWPAANWRKLVGNARRAGLSVKVFGAPQERGRIAADLGGAIDGGVELITDSLDVFFDALSKVKALVCLDSFAIHAAHAIGVPSIMINGANLAAMWLPPGAGLIDGGLGLECAPCMNRPACLASREPYRCMRDIPVERVWSALSKLCEMPARALS